MTTQLACAQVDSVRLGNKGWVIMNKKIEKFMKEWKNSESEIFDSALNSFIDRIGAGEVVAHNEIRVALADVRLYVGEEKIEKELHKAANKRKVFLVKEKGFYALA